MAGRGLSRGGLDVDGAFVPRTRPRLRHALILAVVASALTAPAPAAASSTACPGASVQAAKGELDRVRSAVVCLVNRERRARGLNSLRQSSRLRRAARRHSADMVRRRYFSHLSPEGRDHVDRARRARYVVAKSSWRLAENLAWMPSGNATAADLVKAWMASPTHRDNILRRGMDHAGVGLVLGTPSGARGVTGTLVFGRRR